MSTPNTSNTSTAINAILVHSSIRKYTLALLETFSGLKVEYQTKDKTGNPIYKYKDIPIKYSTREKLNLLDEVDEKNIISGNYNVLPRTSLALSTITKNNERQSNKFNKIATTDFGEFFFNAVSYDFAYDMSIMCRGMNEASMIIEQIASRFRPNYTVLINEIPNQVKPTSVPIQILDIALEASDYDEISTNVITINVGLNLKGNFYSPLQQMEKIKNIKMYLNMWYHSIANDYSRAKLYDFDVTNDIVQPPIEHELVDDAGQFGKVVPVILDIECNDGNTNENIPATCVFTDYDAKESEISFIWNVTGSAKIIGTGKTISIVDSNTEIVELSCSILDVYNNTSNVFIKKVTIS